MSAVRRLWDISEEMSAIEQALETEGFGEEEIREAIDAYLESSEELPRKLDGYAALIQEREARAKAREDEASRLCALATADRNGAKQLRLRLKDFLEVHGLTKVQTPRYVVAVQANGGHQPMELPADPAALPEAYRVSVTTVTPLTEDIRRALAAGEEIPGARLLPRGTHLRIR